jgi:flagellar basal-body rod protein FlgF
MIKGIYTAVSAMIASARMQALKVHNIANLNTPGFKQVFTTLQEFKQTEVIPINLNDRNASQQSIGKLGLGVMTTEVRSKFSNGSLQATGEPYDFAIQGDGFFRIKTAAGEQYTRDGRFNRNADGELVTVDGNRVLDNSGRPIQIPDGELSADINGRLLVNGMVTTQLGIAEFGHPETQLQKDSGNLFTALMAPDGTIRNSTIQQGYLEMSNVNVVDMMIGAQTYEAAQKIVQIQDELLGKTIGILGKIA